MCRLRMREALIKEISRMRPRIRDVVMLDWKKKCLFCIRKKFSLIKFKAKFSVVKSLLVQNNMVPEPGNMLSVENTSGLVENTGQKERS